MACAQHREAEDTEMSNRTSALWAGEGTKCLLHEIGVTLEQRGSSNIWVEMALALGSYLSALMFCRCRASADLIPTL